MAKTSSERVSPLYHNGGSAPSLSNGPGKQQSTSPQRPTSLRAAMRAVNSEIDGFGAPSDTPSEEDYDELHKSSASLLTRRKRNGTKAAEQKLRGLAVVDLDPATVGAASHQDVVSLSENSSAEHLPPLVTGRIRGQKDLNAYVLAADDKELRDIIQRGLERARDPKPSKRPGKFSDLVFTRQFSTFDRQNQDAANSPFHGFYTLFWLAVFLFMMKIAAENWKAHGTPLGTNEIMKSMFRRDVILLLMSDGIMCGITGVSWLLQRLIFAGYIDWDRAGWIIQNLWQTLFIGGVIELTLLREWPWTHTVFFVLHGIVMLMKQHSYSFYNGYLSSVYKKRASLLSKLKKLENIAPIQSPSATSPPASAISVSHLAHPPSAIEMKERRLSMTQNVGPAGTDLDKIAAAIESGEPLDVDQIHIFERIIKWEIDGLADELKGTATDATRAYPNNLTFTNHYEYIVLPTVVYELEYPRSDSINWFYVAEKLSAMLGIIFVMIMLSQAFIYPVVMQTVAMKEMGMPLAERFQYFPWMLSDLMFPFLMEYLLAWYLIWETILNILAELTYFADRSFYDAWWNSVSWDQFARDWNRPVHNFLLRHVYHSSISSMKVNRHTATLITFFLSACVHELVMWSLFKKLRGYLLVLQMCQIPLVQLSRTRWMKGRKTLGNVIFWVGIFTGPSLLCSLYLIL